MSDLKSTQIYYGENVLMMRVDDCLIFGNKGALRRLVEKLEERIAKVETVKKPNVFKCSECGQYFHSTAWGSPVEYCSRCGCRLDWNEDIPMEYFESGGI